MAYAFALLFLKKWCGEFYVRKFSTARFDLVHYEFQSEYSVIIVRLEKRIQSVIPNQIKPSDLCETQSAVYARLSRAFKGEVNIPEIAE